MPRGTLLFSRYDLRQAFEQHRQKGVREIGTLAGNDLSPEAETAVLKRFYDEYAVNPLELVPNGVSVEQTDAQVDVRGDPGRYIRDRSRPFEIPGVRVRYYVAYRGDKQLWEGQASSFTLSPPSASSITDGELVFGFLVPGTDVAPTKAEFDEQMRRINEYLTWSRNEVNQHNEAILPLLRSALVRRREEVAKTQAGIEALGLPIRKKPVTMPSPILTIATAPRSPSVKKRSPKSIKRESHPLSTISHSRSPARTEPTSMPSPST